MNYKTRQPFQNAPYVESQRNFTYFDRSLTSGLTDDIISSPGDFLYIDQASTGVVSVELNMRQGGTLAPILLAAGGSIECDFSSVKLNATAQLNKTVRLIVGNGARIKGGANVNASSMSVSVVDGRLLRTLAAQAFVANASVGAVVGQLSHNQLWNPLGSGKNLYLTKFSVVSPSAQNVTAGDYNAAYGTSGNAAQNKLIGNSTAAVGLTKTTTNAAALKTTAGLSFSISANSTFQYEVQEPFVIPPGRGFVLYSGSSNVDLTTSFEWYEA